MIKPWEICVLVYDYLQKSGYSETSSYFNKECPSLQLPDPPPHIFTCVVDKILTHGDLESRLKSFEETQDRVQAESEKLKSLEKKVINIRKRLKKRKRQHSESEKQAKQCKLSLPNADSSNFLHLQGNASPFIESANRSLYNPGSQLETSSFNNSFQTGSTSTFSPMIMPHTSTVGGIDTYSFTEKHTAENALKTPEKRLSSSRRKAATPKKLTSDIMQGSFIQTLTDNINAKNEEAALDTLNLVEPWLEQFISSLSPECSNPVPSQPSVGDSISYNTDNNINSEEAALSLLALNQSNETETSLQASTQPINTIPIISTASSGLLHCDSGILSTITNQSMITSQAAGETVSNPGANLTVTETPSYSTVGEVNLAQNPSSETTASSSQSTTPKNNMMLFDPIVIRNQKTFTTAQNNPNMDIIVLPPIHSQYQHILPKPNTQSDPVPTSFHLSGDTAAPVYNFVKPSPQQEAQKFFGQMHRPYHQQLSRIDQLYLVDTTERGPKSEHSKTLSKKTGDQKHSKESQIVQVDAVVKEYHDGPELGEEGGMPNTKESFISWDQKIRQSIAETDFKPPPPPGERKKKRRSKAKDRSTGKVKTPLSEVNTQVDESGKKGQKLKIKKRKKKRKKSNKEDGDKPIKSKKKKKKRDKDKECMKKPPITPEFVNESLSSEEGESETSTLRIRHISESDSVMADNLLKTLKSTPGPDKSPLNLENCSTPLPTNPLASFSLTETPVSRIVIDTIKPAFIEENANSSFDINEATRPKPVFVPEGSQNSCSCHSNHYKETSHVKCSGGKAFSFKDQDNADSPKYYNENSTVTVSSLFPTLSSSSVSCSPAQKIADSVQYRSPRPEEESDHEVEEGDSDGEIRETTSKFPPLSSQNKDLLESSDEEQDASVNSADPQFHTTHRLSINLSESDVDSPIKKSPIKSAKLKILPLKSATHKKELVIKTTDKMQATKETSVASPHVVEDERSVLDAESETDRSREITALLQMDGDNDFQELVIDGDEGTPKKTIDIRITRQETYITDKSQHKDVSELVENNKNTANSSVEDSCDAWYQNVKNETKKSLFTCELCRKSFPSLAVLTVHAESCTKMYLVCSNCGRKCSSKSGLTLHKKTCLNLLNNPPRSKEKKKSLSENSKIKISPSSSKSGSSKSGSQKKSTKKKKNVKGERFIGKKDIDDFLGKLRYQ